MKKLCLVMAFALFTLVFAGCESGKSEDLYAKGLEITQLMKEMVDSESYMEIMGAPNMIEDRGSEMSELELSDPVAVYEISLPDIDEFVIKSGFADLSDWNKLSPALKNQLKNRMGFATVANLINASYGSDAIAFCSLYNAIIRNDSSFGEEPVTYLYVFDTDTAVAVTFSGYSAQGIFLFAEDLYSTDGLDEIFEPFGIEYKNIK